MVVIMDSSNASNSNTTNSTCGSLPSSMTTQIKDPAWEWGERQDLLYGYMNLFCFSKIDGIFILNRCVKQ